MENFGIGGGLAALGLWLFIGMVVLGGIWDSIRKREAQHETLRRMLESGRDLDRKLLSDLLGPDEAKQAQDLRVSGLICLALAPGLVLLGWFMSSFAEKMLPLMLGVGGLILCLALGLLYAAKETKS